ncbi:putative MIR1-1HG-AS1 [Bienertia sinuspersici]
MRTPSPRPAVRFLRHNRLSPPYKPFSFIIRSFSILPLEREIKVCFSICDSRSSHLLCWIRSSQRRFFCGSGRMQRYRGDEDLDEYEDEYEDQCEDGGDEDQYEDEEDAEEEEQEKPMSAEAIKYLEMREKMKAKHRSILRKENGKNGVNINHSKLSNFGSFFGPSKPVIADRVIQESKSLLETRHLAPKCLILKMMYVYLVNVNKSNMPSTSASKNGPSNKSPPAQVKSKAQLLKQTRDYSFLLSDDAEIPKPAKDPGPQKSLVAKPGYEDSRSAQVRGKRYEPSSHASGKKGYNGSEKRKPSSGISQLDLRKQPQHNKQASSTSGTGPRPAVQKGLPPKPLSSNDRKMPASSMERKPSATLAGNRAPVVAKTSTLDRQRTPVVKPQTSGVNGRLDHKRDVQLRAENKMLKKENAVASKFQPVKQPGSLQPKLENGHRIKNQKPPGQLRNSSAANKDQRIKKRKSPEPESDFDYRSAIRQMFGRPLQYHDVDDDMDDDDDDMVAGFDDIMKEEMRSARIARKEDEEELIKIQEEERQEMLRKKAKMRKMNRR